MRGTIYAIYQFSQDFLGIDPLYWWTDHPPAHRTQVLVPSSFKEIQGPPTFRYRGWFTNDEDLLTGWKPGLADGTGISLAGVPFRWSGDSGAEMLDRGRSFRRPFKQRGQFTSRHPPLLGLAFMTFEKRNGTWSKADYDQLC